MFPWKKRNQEKVNKNLLFYINSEDLFRFMQEEEVKLRIYGMTCDDCVVTVAKGLTEQRGVLEVSVSLREGIAKVKIDADKINPGDLLQSRVFSKPYNYRAMVVE
jgi:copper chaperone